MAFDLWLWKLPIINRIVGRTGFYAPSEQPSRPTPRAACQGRELGLSIGTMVVEQDLMDNLCPPCLLPDTRLIHCETWALAAARPKEQP